jgi:glutamate N-acetyltransferase/amino-acid N-acetyltransferase
MSQLHLLSPRGFRAGAVYAGIKTKETPDVSLLACDVTANAAAVFTTNKVVAAPVVIGRKHIARGRLRGVVTNSGNANACTGLHGEKDAVEMCRLSSKLLECDPHEILPCSTGIIGHHLPMEKVSRGIAGAFEYLGDSEEHALRFADAILTTDTKRKVASATMKIGRDTITLAGACKGSGMIGPRMALHATMLAYLTTDAKIASPLLRKLLAQASEASFNAVTVDDHTSTNDTACILASGLTGKAITSGADIAKFTKALNEVCQSLAYQIAADGEGATKVVRIDVTGAKKDSDAKAIARSIANSPLVKCAMHGNDPNWGRIVSAAGYIGVPFDPQKAVLKLQGTVVFRKGQPVPFDAGAVSKSLAAREVRVELACNLGKSNATCWTCDLSKDYVTINADYHT